MYGNNKKLFEAIKANDIESLKQCFNEGFDIHAHADYGLSLLHYACECRNTSIETIDFLISSGIDVNIRNNYDRTPLMEAVITNKPINFIQFLISSGANVNAADTNGETPLHFASKGSLDLIKLLIEHGADVNARTKECVSPLTKAVSWKCFDNAFYILQKMKEKYIKDRMSNNN